MILNEMYWRKVQRGEDNRKMWTPSKRVGGNTYTLSAINVAPLREYPRMK